MLRPIHHERRLTRHAPAPAAASSLAATGASVAPAEATSQAIPAASLSPAEKDNLFRQFDTYVAHPGHAP